MTSPVNRRFEGTLPAFFRIEYAEQNGCVEEGGKPAYHLQLIQPCLLNPEDKGDVSTKRRLTSHAMRFSAGLIDVVCSETS
jgi:hypothetical protein